MHNTWRDYTPPPPRDKSRRARVRERSRVTRDLSRRRAGKRRPARRRATVAPAPKPAAAPALTRNDVLLGTEENIVTDCATSGRFVTYDLRGTYAGEGFKDTARTHHRMRVLDTWTPEHQEGSSGCDSSHYFTSRGDGITANAFYTQGVRFLDTSNPTDIRQVGYWRPADTDVWAAYWHNGYVYVADFTRGVDVLRFRGAAGRARTVRLATAAPRGATTPRFSRRLFGGLCPLSVPKA